MIHRPSPLRLFKAYRASVVPDGGWTWENFNGTTNGRRLQADMHKVRIQAMAKGLRLLSKPLARLMREQVETVCNYVDERISRYEGTASIEFMGLKSRVTISGGQGNAFLADALNAVFGDDADIKVSKTVRGALQSVADDVADKTSRLLGTELSEHGRILNQRQANQIATEVTRINDTTRERIQETVRRTLEDGGTVVDAIDSVRKRIPQIATNRVPTIVRTEMGRAADYAAIQSMRESNVVTHVSVVGCEAIEPGIPTFRGIPTCNIKNIPMAFAGDLRFHPNHTGAVIATGFKQTTGHAPDLPLRGGQGAGTFEERGGSTVNEPPPL